MAVKNILAGIAVTDLEGAEVWYDNLLGRAPDVRPMDGLVEWKFPQGGWLQLFTDKERAGKGSVTLVETDFEARLTALKKLGLKINSVMAGDKVKTCIIHDPEGNQIVFAQGFDENHASTR
ncbi:MAG TPA: VOC family protein [Candidatus Udaeobacter sp.]|jgi:hypothetical protein